FTSLREFWPIACRHFAEGFLAAVASPTNHGETVVAAAPSSPTAPRKRSLRIIFPRTKDDGTDGSRKPSVPRCYIGSINGAATPSRDRDGAGDAGQRSRVSLRGLRDVADEVANGRGHRALAIDEVQLRHLVLGKRRAAGHDDADRVLEIERRQVAG